MTVTRILFVASRIHPNYSEILREISKKTFVKVLLSSFDSNDGSDGLDCELFAPSRAGTLRRFTHSSGYSLRRFLFKDNSPPLLWLIRYLVRNRIRTVITRTDNRALYLKVRVASWLLAIRVLTFTQRTLSNESKWSRDAIYPLKDGQIARDRAKNFIPLATSIPDKLPRAKVNCNLTDKGGPLRLVSVGKFQARKGHHLLVEAVALLSTEMSIRLDIFADYNIVSEEYRQEIVDLIQSRELDKSIRLMPLVPRSQMVTSYRDYDIYVYAGWAGERPQSPSTAYDRATGRNGSMLFSMIEAMASGLPVICSSENKVCGSVEDGANGLIFQSGNHYDLAKKIKLMSQRKYEEMGDLSRQIVEREHNVTLVAKDLLKLVEEKRFDLVSVSQPLRSSSWLVRSLFQRVSPYHFERFGNKPNLGTVTES